MACLVDFNESDQMCDSEVQNIEVPLPCQSGPPAIDSEIVHVPTIRSVSVAYDRD